MSARRPALSAWQKHLLGELRTIAATRPEAVAITSHHPRVTSGIASITIELPTADIPTAPGGLRLRDVEEFVIDIDTNPFVPPAVHVTHLRFAEFPHVLVGHHLCIYLDPAREWHPAAGMIGFLERLWQWLTDAAQNRFDAAEALYHPVGGILHASRGAPTIVVREPIPKHPALLRMWMRRRTPTRLDMSMTASADSLPALAVNLSNALPFSAGNHLHQLLALIDKPRLGTPYGDLRDRGWPRPPAILSALAATAARTPAAEPVYFLLAAPLGRGASAHLLCGRLTPDTVRALRTQLRLSPTAPIDITDLPTPTPIEWCSMSDERPDITTRRDQRRPVTGLRGRNVHIWGCGGLGSWIAELVVRAGAEHVTVCDPGTVNGGILVRQNYTEEDIGMNKAEALARRLRALSDQVVVTADPSCVPDAAADTLSSADVLIDATVSIAVAGYIETLAAALGDKRRCVLAQVATDVPTSTLGLMTVATPGSANGLASLDAAAAATVSSEGALEPFRVFWREPGSGDELTPVRGCSIPTFHGSAADLFSLAAIFTNLIGAQINSPTSGVHLIATPMSGYAGAGHKFIPNPSPEIAQEEPASAAQ